MHRLLNSESNGSYLRFVFQQVLEMKQLHIGKTDGPGARFSKAPIINGPVKLLLFKWKIEV